MQFDDDAPLDSSEVEDRRGGSSGGGRGRMVGGGIAGLVVVVVGLIFGISPDRLGLSDDPPARAPGAGSGPNLASGCRTGADASTRAPGRTAAWSP